MTRRGGFKQQEWSLTVLGARILKSRCGWGCTPAKAPGEALSLPLLAQVAPAGPWLIDYTPPSLSPFSHSHGHHLCVSVSLSKIPLFKKYLFLFIIWLHQVSVAAYGIFDLHWDMHDL